MSKFLFVLGVLFSLLGLPVLRAAFEAPWGVSGAALLQVWGCAVVCFIGAYTHRKGNAP